MELSVAPDKVQIVKWHPLAKDILCTVAFDKSVKIWDLNKTENGPQLELQVQIKDKTRVKKLTVFLRLREILRLKDRLSCLELPIAFNYVL